MCKLQQASRLCGFLQNLLRGLRVNFAKIKLVLEFTLYVDECPASQYVRICVRPARAYVLAVSQKQSNVLTVIYLLSVRMLFQKTFPLFLAKSVRSSKLDWTQVTCLVLVRLLSVLSSVFRFRVSSVIADLGDSSVLRGPAASQQERPSQYAFASFGYTQSYLLPGPVSDKSYSSTISSVSFCLTKGPLVIFSSKYSEYNSLAIG